MQWERPQRLFARAALTESGWRQDVLISIGGDGIIESAAANAKPGNAPAFDLLLPGMANVHAHAFQRAMGGLTEVASGAGNDNFWSWREVMYRFLGALAPEHVEIIARAFYIELLKHGYTAVGEFHYLHNDAGGKPYANICELSDRIIAAAQSAGIHVTHLPVMYETANFGGVPANEGQRRFVHTAESYLKLLEALLKQHKNAPGVSFGIAPHSLRAVTPDSLKAILAARPNLGLKHCPIHIHVAEQEKEVADCLAWGRKRPVEWLLEQAPVDERWCLIHATHTTLEELKNIVRAGATVGLCPTTEANLGDGIFSGEAYFKAGGDFGIGSDSNVCVSPWEELRQMEYAQRLILRRRNVLCDAAVPSVGRTLFSKAAAGGARALGLKGGGIAAGRRADLAAVSLAHPLFEGKAGDAVLDTLVFGAVPAVTDVFVAGNRVVKGGAHPEEEESAAALRRVMARLSRA